MLRNRKNCAGSWENREWKVSDIQWMPVWHGSERSEEREHDIVDERLGRCGKG